MTANLEGLLNGIRELNIGILSKDFVPYDSLRKAILHVEHKIKTEGNISMYMISNDIRRLQEQAIIHHIHVANHLIISVVIPLTANRNEFTCYKVIRNDVIILYSEVYTRLDTDVDYISIEKETMQYTYITELKANSMQVNKNYLLRKKIIYNGNDQTWVCNLSLRAFITDIPPVGFAVHHVHHVHHVYNKRAKGGGLAVASHWCIDRGDRSNFYLLINIVIPPLNCY